MNLTGTPEQIIQQVEKTHPEIRDILREARSIVEPNKRAIAEYQAAALYALAKPHNRPGARLLELGTAQGYSSTIFALAMPDAQITTLNPHSGEVIEARRSLKRFGDRIRILEERSWDYLGNYHDEPFDFIFVDADHKNVRMDFPWWDHLKNDAPFIFHDFSPNGSSRPCPPVYRALLEFKDALHRDFDVLIVDDTGVGMAGFVKRSTDSIKDEVRYQLAAANLYSSASFSYLTGLYQLAEAQKDIPGAVVECGCQNGGSAAALALGIGADHPLFLYDNFTGVPKPSLEDGDKAMLRWEATQPDGWAVGSAKEVRACLKKLGIKGTKIVGGDFELTFAGDYDPDPIAILHIDTTLFTSTRLSLYRFYDRVAPGGLVIVSAYHHWEGIRKAVAQYAAESGELPEFHTLEKGAYWTK